VRTFWETKAFAGDDLKSNEEISGAKGRPNTKGSIPPLGSVSDSYRDRNLNI
jgi:hypothetical protein